ncbi:MAG: hypothetical protein LBM01_01845 [Christensenellaceae bacterium]|jgi:hypothetical protein|nr:hypothetical protein [Christensenellaceae bacterium]
MKKVLRTLIVLIIVLCAPLMLVACEGKQSFAKHKGIYTLTSIDVVVTDLGGLGKKGGLQYFNDVLKWNILQHARSVCAGGFLAITDDGKFITKIFTFDNAYSGVLQTIPTGGIGSDFVIGEEYITFYEYNNNQQRVPYLQLQYSANKIVYTIDDPYTLGVWSGDTEGAEYSYVLTFTKEITSISV